MATPHVAAPVTLRCQFCLKRNRIDLARAADRPRCGSCERPMLLDRPVKVAEEDFDVTVLGAATPVLVDFYADWCQPCRVLAPVVDELARQYVGKLLAVKVDTDRAPGLSARMTIRGLPTLALFEFGEEVGRIVGMDPEGLKSLVRNALEAA